MLDFFKISFGALGNSFILISLSITVLTLLNAAAP